MRGLFEDILMINVLVILNTHAICTNYNEKASSKSTHNIRFMVN